MVWKVCKATGVRIPRTEQNAEATLARICDYLKVKQKGGVCSFGVKLVSISSQGWICTGRKWAFVVAAAFVLAARAYFYELDVEEVADFLAIGAGTVKKRIQEIKQLILSVMTHLPWGHMITIENLHVYLPFALEHWELLRSCAPLLRKQQLDMQQKRQKALLQLHGPGMDELDSHAAGAPPRQQRGAKKRSHRRDEDRTEVKATAAKSSDEDDEVKLKAVALLARLMKVAKEDVDPSVRLAALDALRSVAGEGSRHLKDAALHLILDEDEVVQEAASELLEKLDLTDHASELESDKPEEVLVLAPQAVGVEETPQ
ncbi:unnamed protein product, partial [Symbiodinium pilosum]